MPEGKNEPIKSIDELLQVVQQLRRQVRTALAAAERASIDADRLYDSIKRVQQRSTSGLNENEHK